MNKLQSLWYAALCVLVITSSSCVNHKQLLLLAESPEAGLALDGYQKEIELPKLEVQPDDILYITVNSLNDETSRPYNMSSGTSGSGGGGGGNSGNNQLLQGYSVDSLGYIDFPSVGRIRVGGMSLEGVREQVVAALQPYLKNPAVNVKFLNFRYSIVGQISNPGTFTTINERVSLLEALASAGDLSTYANRHKIYLIREESGIRTIAILDLQDEAFLSSPYYYLKQNDVIYVEPSEDIIATVADPVNRYISFGSAFLSLVTFTLALLARR
ncbi:polysaccharide biosynthesis/export family protein [Lewinella sp. IMCC34183]|uniref:polysaccharide biosynthesis/export family protein n=1 Tax=Lewinella sp. IMCC34183 TaxID=2248762 RepID=UPI0013005E9C|nr:polysaccharide biosynthesis/export family protein [Lewinella sp. IMCC34183]